MASGRLILPIDEPILDASGNPVSGATLTVHIAGTGTLASLFADSALGTPITNPQTSNAAGRLYAQTTVIWADSTQAYDCIVAWPDGTSYTFSNIYLLGAATNTSGFAPIASPLFTGNPRGPTPATNDSSNSLATTAFVKAQAYAPLASPTFTGVPAGPTAAAATSTTQLATTAFVQTAVGVAAPSGTTTGYFKWGGVTLQWTTFSLGASGGASQAVTWPIAFTTALLGVPWIAVNNAALEMTGVNSPTITGCTVQKGATDNFARTGVVWALGT